MTKDYMKQGMQKFYLSIPNFIRELSFIMGAYRPELTV